MKLNNYRYFDITTSKTNPLVKQWPSKYQKFSITDKLAKNIKGMQPGNKLNMCLGLPV